MDILKLANLFCEASLKHNCFQKLNNLKEIDYKLLDLFVKSAGDINDSRVVKGLDNLTVLDNAIKNLASNNPRYGIRLNNVNHIGFNMHYDFNTPLGIYFYPLTPEIYSQAMSGTLPYLADETYIHLIKIKGKILTVQTYNNFDEDFEKMKSLHPDININKSKFRGTTDFIKLKQLFHFYGEQSGEKVAFYTYKYYKKLGYDSIIDLGGKEIHKNEPTQGAIFSPQGYEVVEVFINPFRTQAAYKDYSRDLVEIPKHEKDNIYKIRDSNIRFKVLNDLISKDKNNIQLLSKEENSDIKLRLALPFFERYMDHKILQYIEDPAMRSDLAINAFKKTKDTNLLYYIDDIDIKSDLAINAFKETGNSNLLQYIKNPSTQTALATIAFKETGNINLLYYIKSPTIQSDLAIKAFKETKNINLLKYIDISKQSDLVINAFKETGNVKLLCYIDFDDRSDLAVKVFKETGDVKLLDHIDLVERADLAIKEFIKTENVDLLAYINNTMKSNLAANKFIKTKDYKLFDYIDIDFLSLDNKYRLVYIVKNFKILELFSSFLSDGAGYDYVMNLLDYDDDQGLKLLTFIPSVKTSDILTVEEYIIPYCINNNIRSVEELCTKLTSKFNFNFELNLPKYSIAKINNAIALKSKLASFVDFLF